MAGKFDLGAMLAEPQLNAEYKRAAEVDAQIKQSAMQAQQNIYDMAMGFKKMRDEKLYKALGYENFGDYCEKETGMSRMNVYNYIKVVEKLPQDFVNSSLQIGVKKLTLLTTLDNEQREELAENTDLENTSVRELKEIIKDLQAKNDDLIAECQLSDIKRKEETEKLENDLERLKKVQNVYEEDLKNITNEKSELEKKLKDAQNELKDKPIEIVSNSENEEKLKSQIDELKRENEKISDDAKKMRADYEKVLAEKRKEETVPDDKETFRLYLSTAVDSIKRLCEYVKKNTGSNNYSLYREKSVQLADIIRRELEE